MVFGVILSSILVTAVGLGTWRYSVLTYGPEIDVLYVFWLFIAFDIVYAIWDTFVYNYKWLAASYNKKEETKKKEDTFEMTTVTTNSKDNLQDPPSKEPSKVECKWSPYHCADLYFMYI